MSTEAMKLALEALESCDTGHITDGSRQWYDERLVDKAITALDEALAQPQDFSDAYQGAREDLAIWKKRALEAEELNRKFIADINGQTFMGEPAQQEIVAWAISYDGETPYAIWPDGDGALLDLEVKRQGGTTCKLPLYISALAQEIVCSTGLCHYRKPLTLDEVWLDDELMKLNAVLGVHMDYFMRVIRAIEAAHKIKGDA